MESRQDFKVQLFGPFQARLNGASLTTFYSAKAQALLAYLLVEPNCPHTREFLATLLWGDQTSQKARTNLRTTFAKLRKLLAPLEADAPLFTATRQTIQLNLNPAHHWVDVLAFDNLLTGCQDKPVDVPACAEAMSQAVALYRGEFLSGLIIEHAEPFEAWRLAQQEKYHMKVLSLLSCLTGYHLLDQYGQLDYQRAEQYARQQLQMEPWSEAAHEQLMQILAETGQQAGALAQYETCRRLLAEELGAEPSPETEALAEQIRRGRFSRGAMVPSPAPSAPRIDWPEVPIMGDFFGRADELAQLQQWLIYERCRLVTIAGIGGVGKTTLAAQLARAVADQFDVVIWRSLLNAPTLDELLPGVLQTLNGKPVIDLPDSLAEKLPLLLHQLRQQRCLLVLDNLETILQSNPAGQYRPGYEDYGRLIETLVQHDHQSCLLLTGREQPQSRWLRRSNLPGVQSLALSGLDLAAAQQILQTHGLKVSQTEAGRLASRYSGNPLALNLLAQTIEDLYFGDVEAFLTEETLIFADIREVLDKQFNRLSALEQDILLWLAINREPMFASDLTTAFVRPVRQRELLETLYALERRSLLERSEGGFRLQNVITEYLIDQFIGQACQEITSGHLERLHRHPLINVQAKEYVRQSQIRLLLQPIAEQLVAYFGRQGLSGHFQMLLDDLRQSTAGVPSYAGGTLLNLLLYLDIDLTGFDFSHLTLWEVDLRNRTLLGVNFAGVDLARCTFTQTFGRVEAVAISPDGQWLAAGGDGGEVRLYQLANSQLMDTLIEHTNTVTSLAFSPNGELLASAAHDGTIRLWHLKGERPIQVLNNHSAQADIAFSPDGTLLAGAGHDHMVRLWEVHTGTLLVILEGHTDIVHTLTFHPWRDLLVSGAYDGDLHWWDISQLRHQASSCPDQAPEPVRTFSLEGKQICAAAFSPDGRHLASSTNLGLITLWDTSSGQPHHIYSDHTQPVWSLIFSLDGRFLFSSGNSFHPIRVWDVNQPEPVNNLRQTGGGAIWSLALSPDGRTLASGSENGLVELWDVTEPAKASLIQSHFGYRKETLRLAWSPCGRWVAAGDIHGAVRVWDVREVRPKLHRLLLGCEREVIALAFSPDGKLLACTGGTPKQHRFQLWDVESGTRRATVPTNIQVTSLAFAAGGTCLISAQDNGIVHFWDVSNPDEIIRCKTIDTQHHTPYGVICSPDCTSMISYGSGKVCLWQLETGDNIRTIPGYGGNTFVAIDPNWRLLACTGPDYSISLWDLIEPETEGPLRRLVGHTHGILSAAFSPDGTWLLSGSLDRSLRLWDVATGEQIALLGEHPQYVLGVAFSPDGERAASVGKEGSLRIWQVKTGECLHVLHAPGPYEGMNISGVTGITEAQKLALKALGAVEDG